MATITMCIDHDYILYIHACPIGTAPKPCAYFRSYYYAIMSLCNVPTVTWLIMVKHSSSYTSVLKYSMQISTSMMHICILYSTVYLLSE